jgi:YggT family protein
MTVLGYFLGAIASVLHFILTSIFWLVIIYAILSWVNADPYNGIVRFIRSIVEPLLRPIRKYVPPRRTWY